MTPEPWDDEDGNAATPDHFVYDQPPDTNSQTAADSGTGGSASSAASTPASSAAAPPAAAPVGQGDYIVQNGDCMSSIAFTHGFFWQTLWDLPENAGLKSTRKDPHILFPGDRVTIPALRVKNQSAATDQLHQFKRKGVPSVLKFKLLEEPPQDWSPDQDEAQMNDASATVQKPARSDVARANVAWALNIEGTLYNGTTGADGVIQVNISPAARTGTLTLEPGTPNEQQIPLLLGTYRPLDSLGGIKQRLANLGFDCGDRNEDTSPAFEQCVSGFQDKYGLTVNGQADSATVAKLKEVAAGES